MAAATAAARTLTVYVDYKSPYAYLAKDPIYALARELPVTLDWLPYVLDIPSFLGSATLDGQGNLIAADRNPHQWRRVRYSYMDCRRQAQQRGLVIRGPQKIWDSTLAAAGLLFAKRQGEEVLRRYQDITFARFWKRELDIEDPRVIAAVLGDAGGDTGHLAEYLAADGPAEVAQISRAAEERGVFGVPSMILDGELFWGREHLPDIRDRLAAPPP